MPQINTENRKIVVFDETASFTVTLPPDAKITFGPTIPYTARQEERAENRYRPTDRSYSLRIYRGNKENLYAVFPGVRGFRDLSLVVEVQDDAEEASLEDSERDRPNQPIGQRRIPGRIPPAAAESRAASRNRRREIEELRRVETRVITEATPTPELPSF